MKAELVEKGPLSVVVDAVSWQDYLGGIIQHHCSSHWPNHAVLVVGYDATGRPVSQNFFFFFQHQQQHLFLLHLPEPSPYHGGGVCVS